MKPVGGGSTKNDSRINLRELMRFASTRGLPPMAPVIPACAPPKTWASLFLITLVRRRAGNARDIGIRRTAEFGSEIEPDKGILVIKRIQVTFYLQLAPEGTGNSGAGARVS
jgi:hypothetical protein